MARLAQSTARAGFTLVELLVVIATMLVLAGMTLPALQRGREASRRTACENNLRQIGIALLNYESSSRSLPIGAKSSLTHGQSWWVALLPAMELTSLYEQLDVTGLNSGNVAFNPQNGRVINGVIIEVMACPSSEIPVLWPTGAVQIMMPSYVGISGATSHDNFPEKRVSDCCVNDFNQGQISAGGLLIPNRPVRLKQILDGLSSTLAVAECSDFAIDKKGNLKRIDGSLPVGWLTGTAARGVPPDYTQTFAPPSYNITTVRYPPNLRNFDRPGISRDHGANDPLVSPHPDGVNGVMADGAVRFLSESMDVYLLKSLATRDDGLVTNSEGT
jgi:prepilin-type N-terminal cleavage/methylation domain-containing protein/prepilin-type processing-associated H-X9-DG protein